MSDFLNRLEQFLSSRGRSTAITALTADASTREYFRINWDEGTAIACVYPEPFGPAEQSYLDVTRLFIAGGLPVPKIFDCDGTHGVIIQEDLGSRILRDEMLNADKEAAARLLSEAITLIARIQTATDKAFELDSIASRLKFDKEKLGWELDFFRTHYFGTFLKKPLSEDDDRLLSEEFSQLAAELETFAVVLCHRDFHAANLMLDRDGMMRIIDHQDARIGSPAYDLVSLLLDRIEHLPSPEFLAEKRKYFLDVRRKLGLPKIDEEEFAYEFRLQTIQRCLKAAGTFSYQSAVRGKTHFIPFIKPMFGISRRGAESLGRFPAIQRILSRELE